MAMLQDVVDHSARPLGCYLLTQRKDTRINFMIRHFHMVPHDRVSVERLLAHHSA